MYSKYLNNNIFIAILDLKVQITSYFRLFGALAGYIPPKHACWVLPLPLQSQDLHYVTVPVKDVFERRGETTLRLPFIMPHELVDYLYEALLNPIFVCGGGVYI